MTVTTNVHIRCEGIFSSIIVAFWSLLWKDIFSKPEAESHTDLWLCVSQKKKASSPAGCSGSFIQTISSKHIRYNQSFQKNTISLSS